MDSLDHPLSVLYYSSMNPHERLYNDFKMKSVLKTHPSPAKREKSKRNSQSKIEDLLLQKGREVKSRNRTLRDRATWQVCKEIKEKPEINQKSKDLAKLHQRRNLLAGSPKRKFFHTPVKAHKSPPQSANDSAVPFNKALDYLAMLEKRLKITSPLPINNH